MTTQAVPCAPFLCGMVAYRVELLQRGEGGPLPDSALSTESALQDESKPTKGMTNSEGEARGLGDLPDHWS